MNTEVAVILTIVAAFLLWNVAPKVVAAVVGLILLVLLMNKWDDLSSIIGAKATSTAKGGILV